MKSAIFKILFLSLCIIANTHFAYAQTASILPQGKTQFLDNNGKPLASGTVDFYIPATTTRKTTWQNSAETIANTNPVVLDAGGRAIIYGDGSYRMVVKDRLNNLIYDQLTSSTGSGGGTSPTATGDGDLVGTIKPWAGMTAPNQYQFAYGQELSRTTYSALYTAITSTQTVFCNSASPTLNGLSDTSNFWIGMSLEVSCVAAGFTTIISKTASSVTMATNANVTTNTTAVFYPWGRGNGTTTFNVPDLRGVVLAGNNIMGGVSSSRMTTTYFGSTDPNSSGALGGNQSHAIISSEIPSITPTGTITNGAITFPNTLVSQTKDVGNSSAILTTPTAPAPAILTSVLAPSQATSTFSGIPQGGGIAVSATVAAGGSGYTNGNQIVTLTGGTCTVQPKLNVGVSGNVVVVVNAIDTAGSCTVAPTNSVGVTGGGGTGATFNVSYSAQPISLIQPTRTTNYIIKVTPDANSATASGVTSLGGMTGSIACGSGILCTGNIISIGALAFTSLTINGCVLGSDTFCNNGSSTFYGQVIFNSARSVASPNMVDDIAVANSITTITGNTGSPISRISKVSFYKPTFTDASALTITDLANVYIDGPPTASGSITATRQWSLMSNSGNVWINGTGGTSGTDARLLVGNFVPSDWPVDAFVVTSTMTGQNSVGINSAPVLGTPPASNKIASAFTAQTQIAAGQAWTTYYGMRLFGPLINAGASVTNVYALNIPSITQGTNNQAVYVEGNATGGRIGFGESSAQHQVVINSNAQQGIVGPSSTQLLMAGDNTSGAVTSMIGWGGANANSQIQGIKVSGTAAAPTATAANTTLFQFFGSGYNGVTPNTYSSGARLDFVSTATIWSGTNNGALLDVYTTPDTTTTNTRAARFNGSGCLGVGTTTDCGAGGIIANTHVQTVPTTVGSLGTCNAAAKGQHKFVTDSNAASYTAGIGAVVAAGGTTNVPVVCDGTNWRIG